MSRYDWSKAPEWARFAATDSNGFVHWCSCEPQIGEHIWISTGDRCSPDDIPQGDWEQSIELRPTEIDTQWPDAVERQIPPMETSA